MSLKSILKAYTPDFLLRRVLYNRSRLQRRADLQRDPEAIFTDIYRNNHWHSGESVSGPGSEVGATVNARTVLPELLRKLNAHSLLDAPCGDFNWMRHVDLAGIQYTGMDIVPPLIEANNQKYASPSVGFVHGDVAKDALPRVDVVLCRDLFLHLPLGVIAQVVANFKRSGSTYLLASSYPARSINYDIVAGDRRPINLKKAPFHFPEPIDVICDDNPAEQTSPENRRTLSLWRMSDLPERR
jgi:hypothetical protein